MKKLTLIVLSFCVLVTGEMFAKEITLDQLLAGTSKVNVSAAKKVSSPQFSENCQGEGKSKSGMCIIAYDNGTYYGETKYGLPNGLGVMEYYDNESVYIGQFSKGNKQGYGSFIWEDGTYFQGNISSKQNISYGLIFVNNLVKPSIYVGGVQTDDIGKRQGFGSHYFYEPGVQHDLQSEPIMIIDGKFLNNIAFDICIITEYGSSKRGYCNGSSPTDYGFKQSNWLIIDHFVEEIQANETRSIENYDKASSIVNQTYEIAFGESIIEEEKKIVEKKQPQYQLIPIEDEYVAIKNANVRKSPFVGSAVVTTIPKNTTVYVSAKVKGDNWLAIEGEEGIIGYSWGDLYVTQKQFAQQEKDLKQQLEEVVENIKKDEPKFWGSGTGFYISNEGHIVTNYHVTHGCEYMLLDEEKMKVIRNDPMTDLALLQSSNAVPYYIGLSDKIVPLKGEQIFAIGFPFGKAMDFGSSDSSITPGHVTNLSGPNNDITQFRMTNALQPGNSGGPVIDTEGKLVGVSVATAAYDYYLEKKGVLPQNINYAIKSSMLNIFLTSGGINATYKKNYSNLSQPEMLNKIDKAVVYLECWTTDERAAKAERGLDILVKTVRDEKAKNK